MAARGRRWTWRLWRATCPRASRRVPSPKTVGGQAAVAAIKRGDPSPRGSPRRLTPELLDEIREFIGEEHGRISVKNRVKSLHIVSYQFTKSHPFVALASVGDPHSAPSAGRSHP